MDLKTVKLSELNPAEYNPRIISKEEFDGLVESLKTFGQQENLIVNKDMTVISGHQRYEAMKKLGFLGSGSTLIACEQTDRICYGMELDPKYVDVIRKRYWKFTHDGNEEGWEDGTKAI